MPKTIRRKDEFTRIGDAKRSREYRKRKRDAVRQVNFCSLMLKSWYADLRLDQKTWISLPEFRRQREFGLADFSPAALDRVATIEKSEVFIGGVRTIIIRPVTVA